MHCLLSCITSKFCWVRLSESILLPSFMDWFRMPTSYLRRWKISMEFLRCYWTFKLAPCLSLFQSASSTKMIFLDLSLIINCYLLSTWQAMIDSWGVPFRNAFCDKEDVHLYEVQEQSFFVHLVWEKLSCYIYKLINMIEPWKKNEKYQCFSWIFFFLLLGAEWQVIL